MPPEGYQYLPDCVWNCSSGGRKALEEASVHADSNLGKKFPNPPKDIHQYGEAFHHRFLQGSEIPKEIRAAGCGYCSTCRIKIICSSFVIEHYDTRRNNEDGSTDTHWGQGKSIEHEYFIEVEQQPTCLV